MMRSASTTPNRSVIFFSVPTNFYVTYRVPGSREEDTTAGRDTEDNEGKKKRPENRSETATTQIVQLLD